MKSLNSSLLNILRNEESWDELLAAATAWHRQSVESDEAALEEQFSALSDIVQAESIVHRWSGFAKSRSSISLQLEHIAVGREISLVLQSLSNVQNRLDEEVRSNLFLLTLEGCLKHSRLHAELINWLMEKLCERSASVSSQAEKLVTTYALFSDRQQPFSALLRGVAEASLERGDLYLAYDFATVACLRADVVVEKVASQILFARLSVHLFRYGQATFHARHALFVIGQQQQAYPAMLAVEATLIIAEVYFVQRKYAQSFKLVEGIDKADLMPEQAALIHLLSSQLYNALGDEVHATLNLSRAWSLVMATGPRPNMLAIIGMSLSAVESYSAQKSLDVLQEALSANRISFLNENPIQILLQSAISEVISKKMQDLQLALKIMKGLTLKYSDWYPPRHPTRVAHFLHLNELRLRAVTELNGDDWEILLELDQCVEYLEATLKRHPQVAYAKGVSARAHELSGDIEGACRILAEGIHIYLEMEYFPPSPKHLLHSREKQRKEMMRQIRHLANLMPERSHGDAEFTQEIFLTYKGNFEIEESVVELLRSQATGRLADLLEEQRSLQLVVAGAWSSGMSSDDGVQGTLAELQTITDEIASLDDARLLTEQLGLRVIGLDDFIACLAPGEALLNICILDDLIFAQIVRQDATVAWHRYDLELERLKEAVERLRTELTGDGSLVAVSRTITSLAPTLRELYDLLISPVHEQLRIGSGLNGLIISADDFLHLVPWDMLVKSKGERGLITLLHEVAVRCLPTPRDLVRLHRFTQ